MTAVGLAPTACLRALACSRPEGYSEHEVPHQKPDIFGLHLTSLVPSLVRKRNLEEANLPDLDGCTV